MDRTRIDLTLNVDLDPVPGAFHTPESAQEIIQAVLTAAMSQYNPVVYLRHKE